MQTLIGIIDLFGRAFAGLEAQRISSTAINVASSLSLFMH